MTGDDKIILAAAKLLREAHVDEHAELRRAFWIAGRCEHCACTHNNGRELKCDICGRPIVNRCAKEGT